MKRWFNEDFSGDSKSLLIAMAGAYVKKAGQFEWKNTWTYKYKDLNYKKFYVADLKKSWWWGMKEKELEDFSPGYGPFALAKFLKEQIKKANVEQFAIMGLSMGGYGAIMLGALLGADEVFVFSPQTYLTNFRFEKAKLHKKYEGLNIDIELTKLKNFLERYGNYKTKYRVYYGSFNKGDTRHAKEIGHCYGVDLRPVPLKKHTVAGPLIEDGTVSDLIKEFIERK